MRIKCFFCGKYTTSFKNYHKSRCEKFYQLSPDILYHEILIHERHKKLMKLLHKKMYIYLKSQNSTDTTYITSDFTFTTKLINENMMKNSSDIKYKYFQNNIKLEQYGIKRLNSFIFFEDRYNFQLIKFNYIRYGYLHYIKLKLDELHFDDDDDEPKKKLLKILRRVLEIENKYFNKTHKINF